MISSRVFTGVCGFNETPDFLMHRELKSPGVPEVLEVPLGFNDHQMYIQRLAGMQMNRLNNRQSK
jgi:hypothetical protein